jgi:hypothetical protein
MPTDTHPPEKKKHSVLPFQDPAWGLINKLVDQQAEDNAELRTVMREGFQTQVDATGKLGEDFKAVTWRQMIVAVLAIATIAGVFGVSTDLDIAGLNVSVNADKNEETAPKETEETPDAAARDNESTP